jgi:hypothetical protein
VTHRALRSKRAVLVGGETAGSGEGLDPEASLRDQKSLLARCGPFKEDFAKLQPRAAAWLASDLSGFVNGHNLLVDGGIITGLSFSAPMALFEEVAAKVTNAAG